MTVQGQTTEAVLKYLTERQQEGMYPPSLVEIGEAVGLSSTSAVSRHITKLQRSGHVRRDGIKSRALRVLIPAENTK